MTDIDTQILTLLNSNPRGMERGAIAKALKATATTSEVSIALGRLISGNKVMKMDGIYTANSDGKAAPATAKATDQRVNDMDIPTMGGGPAPLRMKDVLQKQQVRTTEPARASTSTRPTLAAAPERQATPSPAQDALVTASPLGAEQPAGPPTSANNNGANARCPAIYCEEIHGYRIVVNGQDVGLFELRDSWGAFRLLAGPGDERIIICLEPSLALRDAPDLGGYFEGAKIVAISDSLILVTERKAA